MLKQLIDGFVLDDIREHKGPIDLSDESVRDKADRRFRNILTRELGNAMKSSIFSRIFKRLFRRAINIYYKAVRSFGGPAFWDGKNEIKL